VRTCDCAYTCVDASAAKLIVCIVGSRYEGQWQNSFKHGDGLFVFDDGSVWAGKWERDQPVAAETPFEPAGAHPHLQIEDLLATEPDASSAERGAHDCVHAASWVAEQ
jgi:MORN repeat